MWQRSHETKATPTPQFETAPLFTSGAAMAAAGVTLLFTVKCQEHEVAVNDHVEVEASLTSHSQSSLCKPDSCVSLYCVSDEKASHRISTPLSWCGGSFIIWCLTSVHQANPPCGRRFRKHGVKSVQVTSTNWNLERPRSARRQLLEMYVSVWKQSLKDTIM